MPAVTNPTSIISGGNFIVAGASRGLVLQVLLAIQAFSEAECLVVCEKGTRFLRYSGLVSEYMEVDFQGADDEYFVSLVNQKAHSTSPVMLIPTDCDAVRMTNRVRDRLKVSIIPIPDTEMLDCLENKWRFYQFCRQYGLTTPETCLIENKFALDFEAVASALGTPFVVKPVDQAGSKGVQIISTIQQFRREILENDSYNFAPLVVQRFINGADVGLNLLAISGQVRAMAIQRREYPQHEAAAINFCSNPFLENIAHQLAGASRYNGVMNVDARIEDGTNRVFLLECNPRFWRSVLASAWCGLNFVGISVELPMPKDDMLVLSSGTAATFYHPMFRPSLWRYGLFDRGHRGRMVRAMMKDICLLGSSMIFAVTGKRRAPGVCRQDHADAVG